MQTKPRDARPEALQERRRRYARLLLVGGALLLAYHEYSTFAALGQYKCA
jgi:hypothetical protein